jgi:cation transport ATPase
MNLSERRRLARLLAELDGHPHDEKPDHTNPGRDPANPYLTDPRLRRQRRLALLVAAACCVALAGWIVVLGATLPRHFNAHHWRGVWVNFDVFLLAAFAATAWAIWKERQVLILLLVAIGTMLCCDAWFDVGTSLATRDLWLSLGSAFVAELPLAFLAFAGARRLLRATVDASLRAPASAAARPPEIARAGTRGPANDLTCSLRRTRLSGHGLDEALPRGRAHRPA